MPIVDPEWSRFARAETDRHDHIQTEFREIDEIITREWFVVEMCVDQTKSAQSPFRGANTTDIRQPKFGCITDDDKMHHPRAVDEDSNLPSRFMREMRKRAGELRRDKRVEGHAFAVQLLELSDLRRRKAANVTVYLQVGGS